MVTSIRKHANAQQTHNIECSPSLYCILAKPYLRNKASATHGRNFRAMPLIIEYGAAGNK